MSLRNKLDRAKSKKEFFEELDYYRTMIIKKFGEDDLRSALDKINSVLTLIEENREDFDLSDVSDEFNELNNAIKTELIKRREFYQRKFDNLLKEELKETNLVNLSKLLAMLKEEVEKHQYKYDLQDLILKIDTYFQFINRIYEILSIYKILNYRDATTKIFKFVEDLKEEQFANLKVFIFKIYQDLLRHKLFELSKKHDKLILSEVSDLLDVQPDRLFYFVRLIAQEPRSPIKRFNETTMVLFFR